jgi:hypothetical protein
VLLWAGELPCLLLLLCRLPLPIMLPIGEDNDRTSDMIDTQPLPDLQSEHLPDTHGGFLPLYWNSAWSVHFQPGHEQHVATMNT